MKPTAFNYAEFEALRAAYEKQKEINKEWVDDCEKLQAENEQLKADLAAAEEDKDTLIKHLRLSGWCNGCKNFAGLDGCRAGQMEKCTGKNDLYEWRGEQREGKGEHHEAD